MALRSATAAVPIVATTLAGTAPDVRCRALAATVMTAIWIEAPTLGPMIGAVAIAVVARTGHRVRNQPRDQPRDQAWHRLAGAAAGIAGAVTTLAVFPRIDHSPARGVAVARRDRVDPLPDGTGLVVVANADSGSGRATEVLDTIAAGLPGAEIHCFDRSDDLDAVLIDAARRCRSLGVVGGDGTVNAAVRAALEAGVPLAVFPGGTLNHFARDLGLDSVDDAIEAVRSGQVVAIDVGTVDERAFVNNASIGSYTDLVDERERMERRAGKWPAMVVALVRVLRRGRRFDVRLDGERRTVWMVFFGNGEFEPAGFAPSDRHDLVDGLLDVRLIDADPPLSRVRLVIALLFGALTRSRVYERRCVHSISVCIDDARPIRLAADGETFDGPGAFVVAKRPAALLVHVLDA